MNYERLKDELIRDEGIRLKPYRDTVGKLTVGCGRNLDDDGISSEEALYLLENDIREVEEQLDEALPWWRKLSEPRQRVLLNMGFNLGVKGLLGFHHALTLTEEGRYDEAALAMLSSAWAVQVGARAHRLAQMMREG
jgi:lysozyme